MKQNEDTIKVQRESVRIWLGVGLAVFGCLLIIAGVVIPPAGVIDGSILTALGEIFGLSGACMGVFAINRRDNAKIDYLYNAERRKEEEDETETDSELQE